MKETPVISHKEVNGEVQFNDGDFAEIQTVGIEGIEKDLLLETIQMHCDDTDYSSAEFEERFRVGTWLKITTTVEFTRLEPDEDDSAKNRQPQTQSLQ